MNKLHAQIAGAGFVLGSASLGLGYFIGVKTSEKKFQQQLDEDIKVFKERYKKLNELKNIPEIEEVEEGEATVPAPVVEQNGEYYGLTNKYGGDLDAETAEKVAALIREEPKRYDIRPDRTDAPLRTDLHKDDEPVHEDVVGDGGHCYIQPHDNGIFQYNAEERSESEPYVISEDEYINQEKGYETVCMTYFAKDDSLCDDKEILVDNVDMLVGVKNLKRFGHGSSSPDVVFVRNDKMGLELEIEKVELSYKEFVMGFEDDE